jgi:hypothetical protein
MTYHLSPTGIYRPTTPITHRDDEYDQTGFDILCAMQEQHFWYRGRHRFLLKALDRFTPQEQTQLRAIDLGGGRRLGALFGGSSRQVFPKACACRSFELLSNTERRKSAQQQR